MTTILAIDAAWTAAQPSGIALVQSDGGPWRCLAVAPSYCDFIILSTDGDDKVDWGRPKIAGSKPDPARLIEAALKLASEPVDLVTVDMPLSRREILDRRCADNEISREFGARKCAAHSPNEHRPGKLGACLQRGFEALGFTLQTCAGPSSGPRLLEVYPHPALLVLLGEMERVRYKVGKVRRYWSGKSTSREERRVLLLATYYRIVRHLAKSIKGIPPFLPGTPPVSLASLKSYEDAVDALVCAWVGIVHLEGRTRCYGDADAAIWVPSG